MAKRNCFWCQPEYSQMNREFRRGDWTCPECKRLKIPEQSAAAEAKQEAWAKEQTRYLELERRKAEDAAIAAGVLVRFPVARKEVEA